MAKGKGQPRFLLSDRIVRRSTARPYRVHAVQQALTADLARQVVLPTHRRLNIYTRDPSSPRMDVAVAEALVPYEPLQPGPTGSVVRILDFNETTGETYRPLDLDGDDRPFQLGLKPSTADPRFAQQMCYALAMTTYEDFRQALGRVPDFGFDAHDDEEDVKLHIYPHASEEDNAYYDPDRGALFFGYTFANRNAVGANQPGGLVFTSLSHDVVIHEVTHALLDGMRSHFMLPTNPDVDGFHEGFADLIALFQRFRYRELVRRAMESMGGKLTSRLLIDIARQFGETTSDGRTPLRLAFVHEGGPDDIVERKDQYKHNLEAHDMGAVLLRAVFDAFRWIFDNKTARLRALAPPPSLRMPAELIDLLAGEAEKLAGQFLRILIRAVDYCPPVDVQLGEYLRAIVTADFDLVPDDPWAYREAFVRAFRRYGITVDEVTDLSEDALLWCPPERPLPPVPGLLIDNMAARGLISDADDAEVVERRATALGHYVMDIENHPERLTFFGLAVPSASRQIEPPVIESIRVLQRVGPDGTVNFDLAAEIVQRRKTTSKRWMYGGSTIVLDAMGHIRYLIVKNVQSKERERRVERYLRDKRAYAVHFSDDPPAGAARFRRLHARRRRARGAGA
jgi:hypothetical protein